MHNLNILKNTRKYFKIIYIIHHLTIQKKKALL